MKWLFLVTLALPLLGCKPSINSHPAQSTQSSEAVELAVQRGLSYLKRAGQKGLPDMGIPGVEELVLFTWVVCGADTDELFEKLLERVLRTPLRGTYQAALRALALARLDVQKYREPLKHCALFLLQTQLKNGQWTYTPPEKGESAPDLGDNSNTAYALLGLAACQQAGIEIPKSAIERIEKWWRESQNSDGGWGYRTNVETESYASMTESALGGIALCQSILGKKRTNDLALERGMAWLKDNFSVSENKHSSYQEGRVLYNLYALERAGKFLRLEKFGSHEWYKEGADFLLHTQKADGSWDDGAGTPVANTCLALLFLKRATRFLKF